MDHQFVGLIITAVKDVAVSVIGVLACVYFHRQIPAKVGAALSLATEIAAKCDNQVLVSMIEHAADPGRMRIEAVAGLAALAHTYGIPVDGGKIAELALDELIRLHKAGRLLAMPDWIEKSIEPVTTNAGPMPVTEGGANQ